MSVSRLSTFDPHYLKYLAELGSTNLHASAAVATERLRSALILEPGHHVLEVGCGTGGTMLKFASESQVQVDGVDILEEMLRVARCRFEMRHMTPCSQNRFSEFSLQQTRMLFSAKCGGFSRLEAGLLPTRECGRRGHH